MEQIRCSLTKPFSTDNVSQLVFYLSGLKTSYYNSNRNILSPTVKIKERMLEFMLSQVVVQWFLFQGSPSVGTLFNLIFISVPVSWLNCTALYSLIIAIVNFAKKNRRPRLRSPNLLVVS